MEDQRETKAQLIEELGAARGRAEHIGGHGFAENLIETVRESLLVLDGSQRVISANRSFYRAFKVEPEEAEGRLIYDLGDGQWDIPALRRLLEDILPHDTSFDDYEMEHDFPHIGRRNMLLNARRVQGQVEETEMVLLAIEDVTDRTRAEEAVASLNRELSRRVAELEAANQELDAFGYSVSHDLRAPLRHMDGFSRILLEDHGDQLDEEGRYALQAVCEASAHMNDLINSLLRLSRSTRSEMRWDTVDLSRLAHETLEALLEVEPDRGVELTVEEGLTTQGDGTLLATVMQNLLGNAWKFTAGRDRAQIEFGKLEADGGESYFVRDNGAGFDMAYADKLFAPFQRLHPRGEFEGTGIGLASVQRIIHRHGGRTWAEGVPGEGATFYFTLAGNLA